MRGAAQVTTAATEISAGAGSWTMAFLFNNSDTTIFVQWTAEPDALTAANGIPIIAGGTLRLLGTGATRAGISAIHGGAGNKELRYVLE